MKKEKRGGRDQQGEDRYDDVLDCAVAVEINLADKALAHRVSGPDAHVFQQHLELDPVDGAAAVQVEFGEAHLEVLQVLRRGERGEGGVIEQGEGGGVGKTKNREKLI